MSSTIDDENKFDDDNKSNKESNKGKYSDYTILVAGGAGYIGSHTIVSLISHGFTSIIVLDNYCNSSPKSIERVEKITSHKIITYNIDLSLEDTTQLNNIIKKHSPYCCILLAGLKAVGESVKLPTLYYRKNINIALNLIDTCKNNNCNNFIFSSSATVYGNNKSPYSENNPTGTNITNPYGRTKYMIEEIFKDVCNEYKNINCIILRYFNPIGAHESGLIGEDPNDIPNNLMPYICQVAIGKRPHLNVYAKTKKNDPISERYNTRDGTGERDYIHVMDLAEGHTFSLLNGLISNKNSLLGFEGINKNIFICNLGTGHGTTVYELVNSMRKASNKEIKCIEANKRPGDIDICLANVEKAKKYLKWQSKKTIQQACIDAWKWQSTNPNGYKD